MIVSLAAERAHTEAQMTGVHAEAVVIEFGRGRHCWLNPLFLMCVGCAKPFRKRKMLPE